MHPYTLVLLERGSLHSNYSYPIESVTLIGVDGENMITALSVDFDEVIKSVFVSTRTTYKYALDNLVPLIGKLEMQRELQGYKFYERLAKDIIKGCVMPPLTIAIIDSDPPKKLNPKMAEDYVTKNIHAFFILDGMQRLNTIRRVSYEHKETFPLDRPIFVNVLICKSMDLLLYRMITLNNGQKPMTARHQIEVIAGNVYDFDSTALAIQTEKRMPGLKRRHGAFKKADLIKAYLAFLTNSVNIDNEKIIQEKMDELIAKKIMESDISDTNVQFDDIVVLLEKYTNNTTLKDWLLVQNNLIGFCAGVRRGIAFFNDASEADFIAAIQVFEDSFSSINVSKIRLGMARRKAVEHFISNIKSLSKIDSSEMLDIISCVI